MGTPVTQASMDKLTALGYALSAVFNDQLQAIASPNSLLNTLFNVQTSATAVERNLGIGGFGAMKALSTRNDDPATASRPWDKDRDGFVLGEGSWMFVLEELDPEVVVVVPGESQRLALRSRIVGVRGCHGVLPLEGLVFAIELETVRGVRKLVLGPAVVRLQLHTTRLVPQP